MAMGGQGGRDDVTCKVVAFMCYCGLLPCLRGGDSTLKWRVHRPRRYRSARSRKPAFVAPCALAVWHTLLGGTDAAKSSCVVRASLSRSAAAPAAYRDDGRTRFRAAQRVLMSSSNAGS